MDFSFSVFQSFSFSSVVLLSCSLVVFLVASGIWYFRKMERTFADVI